MGSCASEWLAALVAWGSLAGCGGGGDAVEVDAVEADTVEVDAVEVDAVEVDAVEVDAVEVDAVEVDADAADADAIDTVEVDTVEVDAWDPTALAGARVYRADRGVALDAPVGPLWQWETVAATGPWHPRDGAGLLWFHDRLWLLGGWYSPTVAAWGDRYTTNEVWASDDLGATWDLVLAHDSAPPATGPGARWYGRHTAGWLTYTYGGVDYLYVVGGDIFQPTADVWRSRDGATWEEVTAEAPWVGRVLQMVGVFRGDLWVLGGQTTIADPATALADVWRSRDGGATWERQADAPWAPRGMVYNPVEHDGRLWIIGGGTYDDDGPRTFHDDVWAFDGDDWTEVAGDGETPWTPREYHNVFVFGDELWVSSGWGEDQQNHGDFWHSPDGVTWTAAPAAGIAPGHADGLAVTSQGVVHASGNAMNTAVHRMVRSVGAAVVGWSDQGDQGTDLAQADPAARPLYRPDGFGAEGGVWLDGESAFLRLDGRVDEPEGRSVFWVGKTSRVVPWSDWVDAAMTVVGDSAGSCRDQAGYSGDQLELVVTDAEGHWSAGHVLRGEGMTDGVARLVGFTHAADGRVQAWVDGVPVGEQALLTYDSVYTGWDRVGAGFADGNRAQVMLGLVVAAPRVLDDDEIAHLTAFARRWTAAPAPR